MSNQQRVSVAMCTYNGEKFLPEQLRSIFTQTSLPDELVICDDGSTDTTEAVVREFAHTAPFLVRFIVNETRLRFAQNFAKCISLCQGDLIILTDQDDVWVETRVQDTREAYAADSRLMFTFSDAPLIDQDGKPTEESIYSNFPIHRRDRKRVDSGVGLLPAIARWGFIYGCTMTMRASMRQTVLPIPPGWSHDEWLSLALSSLGNSTKLRPQTNYRQHGVNSVGVGDWSAAGKWRMAMARDSAAYAKEMAHVMEGHAAALANETLRVTLAPILEKKAAFLAARNKARQRGVIGFGTVVRIVASGGYGAYSAGPKSVVKDLAVMANALAFSRKRKEADASSDMRTRASV